MAAKATPVLVCSLDQLLRERGISGKALAAESGISEASIAKWRRNTFSSVDRRAFGRLCAYLQVEPGDLLKLGSE
jgi:putative transcriptional regulator